MPGVTVGNARCSEACGAAVSVLGIHWRRKEGRHDTHTIDKTVWLTVRKQRRHSSKCFSVYIITKCQRGGIEQLFDVCNEAVRWNHATGAAAVVIMATGTWVECTHRW